MHAPVIIFAAAFAAIANAQSLPNIPSCALNCFVTALTSDGCSTLTDFACHCQKPSLISSVTPCVQAACSAADQAAVISAVTSTCADAGHPISIPSTSSATSASSSSSSSVAPTSSEVPSTSSSASSSIVSSSSVSSSSIESTSTSSSATPTSSSVAPVAPVASTTIVPTPSSNGTVTTPSPSPYTGAGNNVQVGSSFVALALGVAYFI